MIIINADDFGLSESTNRAIIDAFRNGFISSTTMLVNTDAFESGVDLAHEHKINDGYIGLHFNMTYGQPITEHIKHNRMLCNADGGWLARGTIRHFTILDQATKRDIAEELRAQYGKLCASGIKPSHVDSHHHIHCKWPVFKVFTAVLKELGVQKVRIARNVGEINWNNKLLRKYMNSLLRAKGFETTDLFGHPQEYELPQLQHFRCELMVHPDFDEELGLVDLEEGKKIALSEILSPVLAEVNIESFAHKLLMTL